MKAQVRGASQSRWLCERATAKKWRAADGIGLEWSVALRQAQCDREMKNMKYLLDNSIYAMGQNGMKRYTGCISPTERRERACEDEGDDGL